MLFGWQWPIFLAPENSLKVRFLSGSGLGMQGGLQFREKLQQHDFVVVQCVSNELTFDTQETNIDPDFPGALSKSYRRLAHWAQKQ